jgi:hypothetical protein
MIFTCLVGDMRHEWSHLASTNAICNPLPRKLHYYKCLLSFRDIGRLLIASSYISRIIRATRSYRLLRERMLIEMAWQMCYKLQDVAAIRPPDRRQPNHTSRLHVTTPFEHAPKWLQRRWIHDRLRGKNIIIRHTANTNAGVSGPMMAERPAFPWVYPRMYKELNPDAPEYNAKELKSIQDMHEIIPPGERLNQYNRGRPTNLYVNYDVNFMNPHTKYAYHYNIYERRHPDGSPTATCTHESFYEYIWDRELRYDEYYDQDQALLEDDMRRSAEEHDCDNNYVQHCDDMASEVQHHEDMESDRNIDFQLGVQVNSVVDLSHRIDERPYYCRNEFMLHYGNLHCHSSLAYDHDILHDPDHTEQTTIAYTEHDYLLLEELDSAVQAWEESQNVNDSIIDST